MADRKVRIGIVGAGFAARFHTECLRRIHGTEVALAGVTSLRPSSRKQFGADHGMPVFDNVDAMLPAIDLLDVCSPPYAHEEAIISAASAGKGVICEKPLTGWFGPPGADESFRGDIASKKQMLKEVIARLRRIAGAIRRAGVFFGYAENFVYAPGIRKEREIIVKTGAQILRMTGDESHNGSASSSYGIWRLAGGGSLIGKGCHPLGGMLYLKRVEGMARDGRPIRPASVTARVHQLTRLASYRDEGFLRTDYHDIEDCGMMHVVFEDGTVADVTTSEVVLGGIYDFVEVFANNHRSRCNISPVGIIDIYNPSNRQFEDIYTVEKISSKEGWTPTSPDENYSIGYQDEMQDFVASAATGEEPQSGLELALDTTAVIYAAYVSAEKKGAETAVPKL
jgi:predicted dehydrogenase